MNNNKSIKRRDLLKLSVTLAAGAGIGGFVSAGSTTNDPGCKTTVPQELGPFAPLKSRSQKDHDIDLTKVKGQNGTAKGEVIVVQGKILDDNCRPVEGAVVEIWQSNHYGKYNHEYDPGGTHDPNFQGWGQAITNKKGEYLFTTILPGLYIGRTRHIHYKIAKRGYHELVTQLYFDGEERNKRDGLLNSMTHEEQKQVVKGIDRKASSPTVTFDINIAKVATGKLPAKVLREYTGKYEMQHKGEPVEGFINSMLGGTYDKIVVEVKNEGNLLFLGMPFAPKTEVIWKEKDVFDATSFYRCTLHFKRDADGKVKELELLEKDQPPIKAIKIL